jgi:phenylacetate-CoA ligase
VIEQVLSSNVVSWYGHSEMSVLARETAVGVYASLPSYGYAEAVPIEDSSVYCLVCTSLHNRVHPFIRYDTGDLIEPISHLGGSLAFRISEGRVGDFVVDRHGNKHALTAIIFGRHHDAFEHLQHLQIRDEGQGRITLVVTPRDSTVEADTLIQGFDLNDLDIEWRLQIVDAPVRTQAGKIRLKIS